MIALPAVTVNVSVSPPDRVKPSRSNDAPVWAKNVGSLKLTFDLSVHWPLGNALVPSSW